MQHAFLEQSCCDIDGVLCVDPTNDENDDGARYREFLLHSNPKLLPQRRIHALVTSRLEKYRSETEEWLRAHHVEYDRLYMMQLETAEERRRLGNHAAYKAKIYAAERGANLFIESDDGQAWEIFQRTNKPVFCIDSQRYYCDEARVIMEP